MPHSQHAGGGHHSVVRAHGAAAPPLHSVRGAGWALHAVRSLYLSAQSNTEPPCWLLWSGVEHDGWHTTKLILCTTNHVSRDTELGKKQAARAAAEAARAAAAITIQAAVRRRLAEKKVRGSSANFFSAVFCRARCMLCGNGHRSSCVELAASWSPHCRQGQAGWRRRR